MADRRLQVFHTVARLLSFTKAAETLHMTQPAVTFQVRQLEEYFNTRLFDRTHNRISLTEAGRRVFEYADRIFDLYAEMENAVREMTGDISGVVMIGASTTIAEFLLPRVLGEFKARHPGVAPRLFVANSEAVQARIAERSIDLGFIEGDSHLPSLAADVCCTDELRVVCAPSHPLAGEKAVAPKALSEHAYISREPGSGTREVIDHYLQKSGVAPESLQTVMELGSPEALKGLVATGLGFAIMSRSTVAKETRLGQLVEVPLVPRLLRNLSVVYTRERYLSLLVSTFTEFAREQLGTLQATDAAAAQR